MKSKQYRLWLTNRVVIGMVLFFVIMAMWEFKWKPQYRPFYEQGVADYQKGRYHEALVALSKAYDIAPNALDTIVMLGWTNLKLNRLEEARFYFGRALRIDPRTEEAQIGAAFVALETGRGRIDPAAIHKILESRKGDPNILILTAGALEQEGEFAEAVRIYRGLIPDKDYGHAAAVAYQRIYGLEGFDGDRPAESLPDAVRAPQLQVPFHAGDGALWQGGQKFYINGVSLGPGAPGYYPLAPPTAGDLYSGWLQDVGKLNANTLRVYTLLPPAFYRAYHHYRDKGGRAGLMQQIWVGDPPDHDLYTPAFVDGTKAKIRNIIDALHGRGVVPPSKEQSNGIYDQDVAAAVVGILFGGDLDQVTYGQTNIINGGKTHHAGKYVSINDAEASEVWFVEMLDYLVDYETSTYNWQHPVAIENGPEHDPARGDVTEQKLQVSPAYAAGLFAAYSAFPYYPESLTRDPQYLTARDSTGVNPVYGYLRLVRSHFALPLVVTEFGISSSIGVRRLQVNGWNQGGHAEDAQAERLTHLEQTIRDTGCAGGIVFELTDEWYRQGWMREGFETPPDRAMLWLNDLDPAKRYGLIGYRTKKWALFTGDEAAWRNERQLYGATAASALDAFDKEREIRSVQIAADEGYLYLRINVACLDCVNNQHDRKTHLDTAPYAVAINTISGRAGIAALPFGARRMPMGANFILYLGDPGKSRLLVAENYNPYRVANRTDYPNEIQLTYRSGFAPRLAMSGAFVSYPGGNGESPSVLHYGLADPARPDYDSVGEWYADVAHNAVLVRIPWGKLLVTDPSRLQAFYGYSENGGVSAVAMPGVSVAIFALQSKGAAELEQMTVAASLPAADGTQPAMFNWTGWDEVKPEPYYKKAYFALQQEFSGQPAPARGPAGKRSRVDARAAVR